MARARSESSMVERLDELFAALAADGAQRGRPAKAIAARLNAIAIALDEAGQPGLSELAQMVGAAARSTRRQTQQTLERIQGTWSAWQSLYTERPVDADVPVRGAAHAPAAPVRTSMVEVDPALISLFLAETNEHLAAIEESVLALERADDSTAIDVVFRSFHTLKGNAGALGFAAIEDLAHTIETLLDQIRSGEHHAGPGEIEVILAAVDLLTKMVRDLETHGAQPTLRFVDERAALNEAIDRLLNGGTPARTAPGVDRQPDPAVAAVAKAEAPRAPDAERTRALDMVQPTIKVDMRKVDNLVDLVGELVIVQSMIHLDPRITASGDERLNRSLAQARRLASELHRSAIGMRLVPIRPTFQKMRRLVRDLSRKKGVEVELTIHGEDTELDRKVVEEIADPLMHMLRNSIDHGIEDAQTRMRVGKSPIGQLTLTASYEGGSVLISVVDDGRGLDMKKLYDRAVAEGILEAGAKLSEAETHALIFRPGISTAGAVTEISGRGIGMDVVRHNVEALRGRIDIRSQPGVGTTFLIKLPLTLATIDGLVLGVSDQRFVLPTYAVCESFRPSSERLHTIPGKGWVVDVRNELLPLVFLSELFTIAGAVADPTQAAVIVVEDEGRRVALVVDQLLGKQEVVVKSLGEAFATVEGVTGGAIMADGRIGLVLDAGSLIRLRQRETPVRAA